MSFQKISNFASKEKSSNLFMIFSLTFNFALWLAIVIMKTDEVKMDAEDDLVQNKLDNQVDFMKLFIVWSNVFMLGFLLFSKKVLINGAAWLKVLFGCFLVGLNIAALINLGVITKISLNLADGQDSILAFNYDWLTLGISCFTDLAYLLFYGLFKSGRAVVITSALILSEIIIFAVCANLSSDIGVDIGNVTVALVTSSMAVLLWSGKVVLDESGNPKEFRDFLLRDDLVEMEIMVNTDLKA